MNGKEKEKRESRQATLVRLIISRLLGRRAEEHRKKCDKRKIKVAIWEIWLKVEEKEKATI